MIFMYNYVIIGKGNSYLEVLGLFGGKLGPVCGTQHYSSDHQEFELRLTCKLQLWSLRGHGSKLELVIFDTTYFLSDSDTESGWYWWYWPNVSTKSKIIYSLILNSEVYWSSILIYNIAKLIQ